MAQVIASVQDKEKLSLSVPEPVPMHPHVRWSEPLAPSAFWIAAHDRNAAASPRYASVAGEEAFWRDHAPGYDARSPLGADAHEVVAAVAALLDPADRLLEIGPGSGAFTRRLAPHVASVVGIEPSEAMRAEFMRRWREAGPPGVAEPVLIAGTWEDAAPPAADVLFSANAVYRVRDMKQALVRMDRAAGRHVVLVQTLDPQGAGPLVADIDGRRVERPRAYAIADILDELGIAHRLRAFIVQRTQPFEVALIDWPAGAGAR